MRPTTNITRVRGSEALAREPARACRGCRRSISPPELRRRSPPPTTRIELYSAAMFVLIDFQRSEPQGLEAFGEPHRIGLENHQIRFQAPRWLPNSAKRSRRSWASGCASGG